MSCMVWLLWCPFAYIIKEINTKFYVLHKIIIVKITSTANDFVSPEVNKPADDYVVQPNFLSGNWNFAKILLNWYLCNISRRILLDPKQISAWKMRRVKVKGHELRSVLCLENVDCVTLTKIIWFWRSVVNKVFAIKSRRTSQSSNMCLRKYFLCWRLV